MFFVNATIDRLVWTAEHADAVEITPFPTHERLTFPIGRSPSARRGGNHLCGVARNLSILAAAGAQSKVA
jgi:hypothetical protein